MFVWAFVLSVFFMTRGFTLPIGSEQFSNSFLRLWGQASRRGGWNIGLAVSGGVDSMALAFLLKDFRASRPGDFNLYAFVVDHKSREESSQQAGEVSDKLESIGIPTSILQLQWNEGVDPLQLHNFETVARLGRYQALARACREFSIRYLCLAHHEEDQVETVMMRMMNGYTGLGVRGIKAISSLPESFGKVDALKVPLSNQSRPNRCRAKQAMTPDNSVTILRPLLGFKKCNLIATCRNAGISWVEDKSNFDRTLTQRNAIRHLLANHNVPLSLSYANMISLAQDMNSRASDLFERASQLLRNLAVSLDARTGLLRFKVPFKASRSHKNLLANSVAMKRLVQLIQTIPDLQTDAADQIANTIFPDATARVELPKQFSSAKLSWKPQCSTSGSGDWILWSVNRQPHQRHEAEPVCRWNHRQSSALNRSSQTSANKWQLFDGRFWISVDTTKDDIVARFFKEKDMTRLRQTLSSYALTNLKSLLKIAAPGKVRWTIPILTTDDDRKLLALPSIDINFDRDNSHGCWEILYQNENPQDRELIKIIH